MQRKWTEGRSANPNPDPEPDPEPNLPLTLVEGVHAEEVDRGQVEGRVAGRTLGELEDLGDAGRYGEMWGDLGRSGVWGDLGRSGEIYVQAEHLESWKTWEI